MAADAVYSAVKTFLGTDANIESLRNSESGNLPAFRWENEDFTKPAPPAEFVSVAITGMLFGQESIGASRQADNRWDETGKFWFSVFVPAGTGLGRALQLGQGIAGLFRGLQLLGDSLEFGDARIGQGAPSEEEGNWYELPVVIEWRQSEA